MLQRGEGPLRKVFTISSLQGCCLDINNWMIAALINEYIGVIAELHLLFTATTTAVQQFEQHTKK